MGRHGRTGRGRRGLRGQERVRLPEVVPSWLPPGGEIPLGHGAAVSRQRNPAVIKRATCSPLCQNDRDAKDFSRCFSPAPAAMRA